MSEILKAAFQKPRALTQNRNHFIVNKGKIPKYFWDLYPIGNEYYHEFNPFFVHLIYDAKVFSEFPVFTVRDGIYAFAEFIIKNLKEIPAWNTLFLIPENYAILVPESHRPYFLSYSISQMNKPEIRKAKSVTIFGLLCDQYFTSYEKITEKLSTLKDLAPDATVNVCLPQRRNPMDMMDKENLHYIHVPELIREKLGNRKVQWLKLRDLLDMSVYQNSYLIDLIDGNSLTSDSYFQYWFLSRGGMAQAVPVDEKKDSIFEIDLSFHHKIQVRPLPEVTPQIAELIFFAKMFKGEFATSPKFQEEVRKIISF